MRVLLVDDHKLFAEAVRTLLEGRGMEVFLATSGNEGLAMVDRLSPDVAVVDVRLPDVSGIEVARRIAKDHPAVRVLGLCAVEDDRTMAEASRAGFHGFLMKDSSVTHFVHSLRAAAHGQMVSPHRIPTASLQSRSSSERDAALLAGHLTAREREVLGLLVGGASSEQMVRTLSVSPNTVRTHIQGVLTKLQVHSRLEAATFAVRHGIVKIPRASLAG